MILERLCKKVKCYYCATVVRQKDAVVLKLMWQGERKEKIWICRRCAAVIKYINASNDVSSWRSKYDK